VLALGVAIFAGTRLASAATSSPQRADQLKAGYLFNFAKFVEWPATAMTDSPLTMCFVGAAGVREALAKDLTDKRIGARPLAVRALDDVTDMGGCSVLYVEAAAGEAFRQSRERVRDAGAVLTVSDAQGFARAGGMIELFTEVNRLRFNVNVDSARRAGLRISSSLLELASAVVKEES
jgi:hypothetical protein